MELPTIYWPVMTDGVLVDVQRAAAGPLRWTLGDDPLDIIPSLNGVAPASPEAP